MDIIDPLVVENEPDWRRSLRDSKRREYSKSPSRSNSIKSKSRSSGKILSVKRLNSLRSSNHHSPKKSIGGSPTVKSYLIADVPETVHEQSYEWGKKENINMPKEIPADQIPVKKPKW